MKFWNKHKASACLLVYGISLQKRSNKSTSRNLNCIFMSCCSLEICTNLRMYLQGNRQCFLLSKTHTPNGRLVFKNFLFISQTTTNCLGTKNAAYYRNWNNQNFKYTHVAIFTQNADVPGTPKNAWGILLKLVDLCGKNEMVEPYKCLQSILSLACWGSQKKVGLEKNRSCWFLCLLLKC